MPETRSQSTLHFIRRFGVILLVFTLCLWILQPVLVPLLISLTLYALASPLCSELVRRGWPRLLAISLMLILIIGLCVLAITYAVPRFLEQLSQLEDVLPELMHQLQLQLNGISALTLQKLGIPIQLDDLVKPLLSQSASLGNQILLTATDQLLSLTLTLALIPLISFFLLRDFRLWRNGLMALLPNSQFEFGWLIYHRMSRQLRAYIRGVMLQSLIISVFTACGFLLLGIDIAALLGIMTGLLNLIPYIGPLLAMILSALVVLSMPEFEPVMLPMAVGVIIAAQLLDNFYIVPHLLGQAVDLHPLLVIIGLLVAGQWFGVLGIMLAIPVLSGMKILLMSLMQQERDCLPLGSA